MSAWWWVVVFLLLMPACLPAAVYATWDAPELDKYACVWFIQKYVDPKAEFRFHPLGEEIIEGIPFDVPFARWRREGSRSTLDILVEENGIRHPRIEHLRALIREVEISPWARPPSDEAARMEEALRTILEQLVKPEEKTRAAVSFFEKYFKEQ